MRSYLTKTIADLPPGEQDPKRSFVHHYTHLLPDGLRNEGYQINVTDGLNPLGVPELVVKALAPDGDRLKSIGFLDAMHDQTSNSVHISESHLNEQHRSKGLGMVMYEALLAHAKQKGIGRVYGGHHSTMAHRVHAKLAAKHGLSYEGKPAIGGTYLTVGEWDRAEPGPHDEKYDSYDYTIKSEQHKAVAKLNVPARYLAKAEPNLFLEVELEDCKGAAVMQTDTWARLMKHLEAARRMAGLAEGDLSLAEARQVFAEEDTDDIAGAALQAYRIPNTEANKIALQTFLEAPDFGKAEVLPTVTSYKIAPVNGEAVTIADAVQRAADSGYINAVKLNGKHSKGTMLAKDPQTKKVYLLKPGSGKNSPAKGVSEIVATQSEREAAFWHVADAWGIGDAFPRADLILVNNHQTAAMELLGTTYRNLGSKKREDPALPARILENYRQNATLFKWSLIDFVLGNPDRHSQNMMVDTDERVVKLIDHGSALAGQSFDPATDDNSFIPFYLRAWTNRKFKEMKPQERMRYMPGLDRRAEQLFDQWVAGLDPDMMAEILHDYNVNAEPALQRLAMVRAMPGPKWVVLNKCWAGAV
jgi:GNAT superfamily N-acetyltransferase